MSDPIDPSPSTPVAALDPAAATPRITAPPERARVEPSEKHTSALPLLYLLGFVVLVLAVGYLYLHPPGDLQQAENATSAKLEALAGRVDQLEKRPVADLAAYDRRFAGIESRLAGLEARPVPVPTDLAPLTSKLDGLSGKLDATAGKIDTGAAALTGRLDTLEKRLVDAEKLAQSGADTASATAAQVDSKLGAAAGAVDAKLAQVDAKIGSATGALDAKLAQTTAQLGSQVDAKLAQSNAQLGSQVDAKVGSATGALDAKLAQSAAQVNSQVEAKLGTMTETARRLASFQAAGAALEAGQKLGPIPGAPPALARFADRAPPTEFALRQSFGPAADAALRTSQPVVSQDKPFLDRLWTRAQSSVSVREGDHVLVGDPVAGMLGQARKALDGGDLAAALAALQGLQGAPKEAMADWIGQAQALLDARAAVAQLAAHG